jgi:hypothetical protein
MEAIFSLELTILKLVCLFRISDFGLRPSFGFRPSGFGFRAKVPL